MEEALPVPARSKEEEGKEEEEENVIAHAVPAPPAVALENPVLLSVEQAQQRVDELAREEAQHRERALGLIGKDYVRQVEEDPCFAEPESDEFRERILRHSAPLVQQWGDIRLRRAQAQTALERAQSRRRLSNLCAADAWEYTQRLEARVQELEALVHRMQPKLEILDAIMRGTCETLNLQDEEDLFMANGVLGSGNGARLLLDAGYSIEKLREGGFDSQKIKEAHSNTGREFGIQEALRAGMDWFSILHDFCCGRKPGLAELRTLGYSPQDIEANLFANTPKLLRHDVLADLNIRKKHMRDAGFTDAELRGTAWA